MVGGCPRAIRIRPLSGAERCRRTDRENCSGRWRHKVRLLWGIGEKVNGSWTRLYVQGLGGKLVESSDGGTKFFVTNHLGTIAARMDLSGQTMEIYRYLPYGERYAGNQTPHQYTGKERDSESGLDYFGARDYPSAHGRWMGVDPVLGEQNIPQRLNRYSYSLADPVSHLDPNGADPVYYGLIQALLFHYYNNYVKVVGYISHPPSIGVNSIYKRAVANVGAQQHMLHDTDPTNKAFPDSSSMSSINTARLLAIDATNIKSFLDDPKGARCAGQFIALAVVFAPAIASGTGEAIAISTALGALSTALMAYGDGQASGRDLALASSNVFASVDIDIAGGAFGAAGYSEWGSRFRGAIATIPVQAFMGTIDGQRHNAPTRMGMTCNDVWDQSNDSVQYLMGLIGVSIGTALPSYGNQILSDCGFSDRP